MLDNTCIETVAKYAQFPGILLYLLSMPVFNVCTMFPGRKNRKKSIESIICAKSLYLQRNSQLYSSVCCIKDSSFNFYSARPDGQFDM